MTHEPQSPDPQSKSNKTRSIWEQITRILAPQLENRKHLTEILVEAKANNVIDNDAFHMVEGVLAVSDLQARDIMIPRSRMVLIEKDEPLTELLPKIIESGHSRFPVTGDDNDDVVGILLAKDLLSHVLHHKDQPFQIRDVLRPVFFVPESKRLNVLLKEFRINRNHMAVVIDEYGGVCGLVTIEDILEEIVGEIADEHDSESQDAQIRRQDADHYAVDALTPIEAFNDYFNAHFVDDQNDTIGGMVMQHFGHMPQKGEKTQISSFVFEVLSADDRRLKRLRVKRVV
jgi:magnesium and cobalt transporter